MGKDCPLLQVYALTEAPNFCSQSFAKFEGVENVGYLLKGQEMKLVSIPELGYFSEGEEPEGEIFVRGPTLFKGYYNRPKETEKHLIEGWFKTGDVGRVTKEGKLQIIDRVKHFVKIGNGEFIALEGLECLYTTSPFVKPSGICIVYNSLKEFICAIILIDTDYTLMWKERNFQNDIEKGKVNDINEIIKWSELKNAVLQSFRDLSITNKRKPFEHIRDVTIFNDEWNPMNGLSTPSFKLKRRKIFTKYKTEINKMFGISEKEKKNVDKEILLKQIEEKYPDYDSKLVLKVLNIIGLPLEQIDFSKTVQELGIDSLTGVLLVNELKKIRKDIGFLQLTQYSIGDVLKYITGVSLNTEIIEIKERVVDLEIEHKKIQQILGKFKEKEVCKTLGVFLTGSSGYLGKKLIVDLLSELSEEVKIYCLVRKSSKDKLVMFEKNPRVVIVEGDLKDVRFGLSQEKFEELESNIQIIVHGGAYVNHFLSYDDMYSVNVRSVFDIVELSQGWKPIHLISSIIVFGAENRSKCNIESLKISNSLGYRATKWAVECLLRKNYKNLVVHSSSFLGPSKSDPSYFNKDDWFYVFVKELFSTRLVHKGDLFEIPFDMVSVDFVSSVIAKTTRLSIDQNFVGKTFLYSLENVSLLDVARYIEKSTGKSFKVIEDFDIYKSKIMELAVKRKDMTIIPFITSVDENNELLDFFMNRQYGLSKDLMELIENENIQKEKKYSMEELKPSFDILMKKNSE